MAKSKSPKFRKGQVVMVRDQGFEYPVKLNKLTSIGNGEERGFRWFDSLDHVEYEQRMRPLTSREMGHRRKEKSK